MALAVDQNFIMKMHGGGVSGPARAADIISAPNTLAGFEAGSEGGKVPISGFNAVPVTDDDGVAVTAHLRHGFHDAVAAGVDGRGRARIKINAVMKTAGAALPRAKAGRNA